MEAPTHIIEFILSQPPPVQDQDQDLTALISNLTLESPIITDPQQHREWLKAYHLDQQIAQLTQLTPDPAKLRDYYDLEVPGCKERLAEIKNPQIRAKLEYFYNVPFYEQKSAEWLNQRNQYLTASTISVILGFQGTRALHQLLLEKVSLGKLRTFFGNQATQWGTKYEPVATATYCLRQGVKVHEFGLIPSRQWPFLGVSPDGISERGIMLEIKCPYSRVIDGQIKEAYYHQMQEQMWVCDFQTCHFLECKIKEVPEDLFWTEFPFYQQEQGIVLTYIRSPEDCSPRYLYSPVKYSHAPKRLYDWYKQQIASCPGIIVNEAYWRMEVYHCQTVKRDPTWIDTYLPLLEHFWQQVIKWRHTPDGLQQLQKMSGDDIQSIFPQIKTTTPSYKARIDKSPDIELSGCLL